MTAPNYIVTAPSYNPDNGGCIFQHQLVHTLNTMGQRAFLWPQPAIKKRSLRHHIHVLRRNPSSYWEKKPYAVHPDLETPVAHKSDVTPDSIVVYPEIVLGNPLRARNVVRWLLYPPGLAHPYKFGPNEMFFRVGKMSDLPEVTGGAEDLFLWKINPAYRNENRPDRKGTCFIRRKGHAKPAIPETEGAIQVDGLSHEEMAEVFNQCEVFYSYDEATLYSQYAALCGCLSIVVPGLYPSHEAWTQSHSLGKYGVSYGTEKIDHAQATRGQLLEMLQHREANGLATVENFIHKTQARFAPAQVSA